MRYVIDIEQLLGNYIVCRNGKCVTLRQFLKFLEGVEKLENEEFYVNREDNVSNSFQEFGEMYNLVLIKNNVIFPLKNIEIFKRHFLFGLPKSITKIFNKVLSTIEDSKEDFEDYKEAYLEYIDEYKKYEEEKNKIINTLQETKFLDENSKQKIFIKN